MTGPYASASIRGRLFGQNSGSTPTTQRYVHAAVLLLSMIILAILLLGAMFPFVNHLGGSRDNFRTPVRTTRPPQTQAEPGPSIGKCQHVRPENQALIHIL